MRNTRMLASGLLESNKEKDIVDLLDNEEDSKFGERTDAYYEGRLKNPKGHKESWHVQKGCPNYLSRAFNFYGGFVSLSLNEKSNLAENQLIHYYKQTIIELEAKNSVLESEIALLKDLNLRYYRESNHKDDIIAGLHS